MPRFGALAGFVPVWAPLSGATEVKKRWLPVLLGGVSLAGPLQAGEWELTPQIRVAETYTDNVDLRSPGKESEYITELNPGLQVEGRGRRADLALNYRMQNLFFAKEADRSTTFHRLGADGSLELIRRILFLEADATRSQQILDPALAAPSNNRTFGRGRGDVTTLAAGPRLQYALGSFAQARARYRIERVEFASRFGSRTQQTANATLSSGPRFNRVGWRLTYERRDEDGRGSGDRRRRGLLGRGDRTLQRLEGELNTRIGAKTQLFATGGYEDNQFARAPGRRRPDGPFWNVGLRWRPSRHTSLEGFYGERFFGSNWRVSFTHQGPTWNADLSYNETLITQTDFQTGLSRGLIPGQVGSLGPQLTVVDAGVILQKRVQARLGWSRGPTNLDLTGFVGEREFQGRDLEGQTYGGSLQVSWQVGQRTDLQAGGRWHRQDFAGTGGTNRRWSARAQIRRQLGDSLDLSVRYVYENREAESQRFLGRNFTQQQATVALDKTF